MASLETQYVKRPCLMPLPPSSTCLPLYKRPFNPPLLSKSEIMHINFKTSYRKFLTPPSAYYPSTMCSKSPFGIHVPLLPLLLHFLLLVQANCTLPISGPFDGANELLAPMRSRISRRFGHFSSNTTEATLDATRTTLTKRWDHNPPENPPENPPHNPPHQGLPQPPPNPALIPAVHVPPQHAPAEGPVAGPTVTYHGAPPVNGPCGLLDGLHQPADWRPSSEAFHLPPGRYRLSWRWTRPPPVGSGALVGIISIERGPSMHTPWPATGLHAPFVVDHTGLGETFMVVVDDTVNTVPDELDWDFPRPTLVDISIVWWIDRLRD